MQSPRTGTFSNECENGINKLIGAFWSAEQTYLTISAACASDEISMLGFSEYFRLCCNRMRTMADKLCQYLVTRGGHLNVGEVSSMIHQNNWNESGVEKFMHIALEMEKQFEQKLNELCTIAKQSNDPMTAEFVESTLLQYQIHVIKITVDHVNGLKVCENAWIYDTLTMKPFVRQLCELLGFGVSGLIRNNWNGSVYGTPSTTGLTRSTHGTGHPTNAEYLQSFANCLRY